MRATMCCPLTRRRDASTRRILRRALETGGSPVEEPRRYSGAGCGFISGSCPE